MEQLLLFDIDGTLTRTQNGYVPFNEAILETFGVDGDIRNVVPGGNTDPLIVQDIFAKAKLKIEFQDADWRTFTINLRRSLPSSRAARHDDNPGPAWRSRVTAGTVGQADFTPSIVTGNFEMTAQVKLEAAGLARYLYRGAYASDSCHRADLPAIAKRRWEAMTGRTLRAEQCIVIGDTPKDLEAARHSQMKSILVGTGRYPIEELLYWEPDGCFRDLSDTESVVATLAEI